MIAGRRYHPYTLALLKQAQLPAVLNSKAMSRRRDVALILTADVFSKT
jgi:hypothetical protein